MAMSVFPPSTANLVFGSLKEQWRLMFNPSDKVWLYDIAQKRWVPAIILSEGYNPSKGSFGVSPTSSVAHGSLTYGATIVDQNRSALLKPHCPCVLRLLVQEGCYRKSEVDEMVRSFDGAVAMAWNHRKLKSPVGPNAYPSMLDSYCFDG